MDGWSVNIPLADLAALIELPKQVKQLSAENEQLRREIDGLRGQLSDFMLFVSDLQNEIKNW